MSKYEKIIWIIIFCVIILFASIFTVKFIEKGNQAKIDKSYDTRLVSIRDGQNIALKYLNVFKIRNKETYNEMKELLYADLSGELQQEVFGMEDYSLNEVGSITYKVKDIKATNESDKFLYKVELEVTGDRVIELYLLIGVRNNKIVSVDKM